MAKTQEFRPNSKLTTALKSEEFKKFIELRQIIGREEYQIIPRIKNDEATIIVEDALKKLKLLLSRARNSLMIWDNNSKVKFKLWYGSTKEESKQIILNRINASIQIANTYTVDNFRAVTPGELPAGSYAGAIPNYPNIIILAEPYGTAGTSGKNSRAGILAHEISHFNAVGITQKDPNSPADDLCDKDCNELEFAKEEPSKALYNSNNYEFFIESFDTSK